MNNISGFVIVMNIFSFKINFNIVFVERFKGQKFIRMIQNTDNNQLAKTEIKLIFKKCYISCYCSRWVSSCGGLERSVRSLLFWQQWLQPAGPQSSMGGGKSSGGHTRSLSGLRNVIFSSKLQIVLLFPPYITIFL